MQLSIICALTRDHAIGNKGKLLYHLSADLRRFKALTTGHTVIMGRKTYESLPNGALPNRRNIVISSQLSYAPLDADVAPSLTHALASCRDEDEVFVIGGGSIYEAAMPLADRLYLTLLDDVAEEADTFFPEIELTDWCIESEEEHEADEKNDVPYTFINCVRR